MTQEVIFVYAKVEKHCRQGENAGYQYFFLFPHFQKACFSGSLKPGIV